MAKSKKTIEKLKLTEKINYYAISIYDIEGRLDDVVDYFLNLKENIKKTNHQILKNSEETNNNYGYINPTKYEDFIDFKIEVDKYYDDIYINIYGIRLETDEEYNNRINYKKIKDEENKRKKLEMEKSEKELYLKLKKKYG